MGGLIFARVLRYNLGMEIVVNIIIVLLVILVSMTLHELAHGFVAYKLGDTTAKEEGRLSFNPVKHLDPYMSVGLPLLLLVLSGGHGPVFGGAKPVPINTRRLKWGEWGFALVAVAGPLTNFLLAFVGFVIGHYTGAIYSSGLAGTIFIQFVVTNLAFFVFNLIPIPPLDGSRLVYAVAPEFIRDIMAGMERYGIMVVMFLVLVLGTAFSSFMNTMIRGMLDVFQNIMI
jgi:Zn-dependent protease